jgi:hypothetical protein
MSSSPKNEAHKYTYRGHRRVSFVASDTAELVELRARQRTFDGGYMRSTLISLGNAIIFLKIFDQRFYNSQYLPIIRLHSLNVCN